ncbi:uncharacterized protein [Oscarella lobularis]|uniref:uncharacterized protein n=1 Tax=Oscarella lobularis TaxID=121494 RepID=UPI003313F0F4
MAPRFLQAKSVLKFVEIGCSLLSIVLIVTFRATVRLYDLSTDPEAREHHIEYYLQRPFRRAAVKLISLNETAPPGYFANYTKIHQGVEAGFELYVAIHCIAILTSIILLVMYKRLVGSESVRRMSPWDTFCNGFFGLSLLIVSVFWTLLYPKMDTDIHTNVEKMIGFICSLDDHRRPTCTAEWASYSQAIASLVFSYACGLAWLVNTWIVFRNSYLHRPDLYEVFNESSPRAEGRGNREVPGGADVSPQGSYQLGAIQTGAGDSG